MEPRSSAVNDEKNILPHPLDKLEDQGDIQSVSVTSPKSEAQAVAGHVKSKLHFGDCLIGEAYAALRQVGAEPAPQKELASKIERQLQSGGCFISYVLITLPQLRKDLSKWLGWAQRRLHCGNLLISKVHAALPQLGTDLQEVATYVLYHLHRGSCLIGEVHAALPPLPPLPPLPHLLHQEFAKDVRGQLHHGKHVRDYAHAALPQSRRDLWAFRSYVLHHLKRGKQLIAMACTASPLSRTDLPKVARYVLYHLQRGSSLISHVRAALPALPPLPPLPPLPHLLWGSAKVVQNRLHSGKLLIGQVHAALPQLGTDLQAFASHVLYQLHLGSCLIGTVLAALPPLSPHQIFVRDAQRRVNFGRRLLGVVRAALPPQNPHQIFVRDAEHRVRAGRRLIGVVLAALPPLSIISVAQCLVDRGIHLERQVHATLDKVRTLCHLAALYKVETNEEVSKMKNSAAEQEVQDR